MDISSVSDDIDNGKGVMSTKCEDDIPSSCDRSVTGTYRSLSDEACKSQNTEMEVTCTKTREKSHRKWFVLVACFLRNFLCLGFPANMTVLNVEFLKAFNESKAITALVQSLTMGIIFSAGVFCGQCVARYGARKTGICGGILASLGLSVSFFATGIPFLVACIGVVSGTGLSLSQISLMTSVGEYFHGRSKILAVSFVVSGAGCGGLIFPYLLDILVYSFGWRGTLLGVGMLMLLMVPFSMICRPVSIGVPTIHTQQSQTTNDAQENSSSKCFNTKNQTCHKFIEKLKYLVNRKGYVVFVFATACGLSGLVSVKIFLIDYLHAKGFDPNSALLLFFFVNIGCTIGMVLPGFCNYIPRINFLIIPATLSGIGVITNALLPSASTFLQHVFILVGYGLSKGGIVSSLSSITMKLVGLENFPFGVGIVMTVFGISLVCGGFLSGLLRDVTESYAASSYGVAIGTGIATGLYITAAVLSRSESDNTDKYYKDRRGSRRRSSILPWKGGVDFFHIT